MEQLKIPASFVIERASMSWREVRFGIDDELLAPGAAVDFALEQLSTLDNPAAALIELAISRRDERLKELIDRLADLEPEISAQDLRDKWLYLVLAWIYQHRSGFTDPLQTAEGVYADFGYPSQMVGFIKYQPMEGPDLGSREANERRMMGRWKAYLDEAGSKYAP